MTDWFPEDPVEALTIELADERARLDRCERAELEHRVADRGVWLDQLARRRARVAVLERELGVALAAEESAAELAEAWRDGDAA